MKYLVSPLVFSIGIMMINSCRSENDIKKIREQQIIIDQFEQEFKRRKEAEESKAFLFMSIKVVRATKRIVPEVRSSYNYELITPKYEVYDLDTITAISGVRQEFGFTGDLEYQLLDHMQIQIENSWRYENYNARAFLERKVHVFKTYKEASIALEEMGRQAPFIKL